MSKFKVIDQDNFEYAPPKELDKEDIVDRDAYLDPQVQIAQMLDAGVRLGEFRSGEFDVEEGDAPVDITRSPGYDVIDAAKDAEAVTARLLAQKKEAEEKLAAIETAKTPPVVEVE